MRSSQWQASTLAATPGQEGPSPPPQKPPPPPLPPPGTVRLASSTPPRRTGEQQRSPTLNGSTQRHLPAAAPSERHGPLKLKPWENKRVELLSPLPQPPLPPPRRQQLLPAVDLAPAASSSEEEAQEGSDELASLLGHSQQQLDNLRSEFLATNERETRALLGQHIHDVKGEIHQEVAEKIGNLDALDGAMATLAATSSLLFAAPVPSQATCLSYVILLSLMCSQVIQGVLTWKLYNNAKAPELILLREFLLQGYLDLMDGFGRQNFSTLDDAIATLGTARALGYWGVVPDSANYTSCRTWDTAFHHQGSEGSERVATAMAVGHCRLWMADDFESIYNYQMYSVYTGDFAMVDMDSIPVCVTEPGILNGFVNLFVGMFLVLMTVTKEFIEMMTALFTVHVPPTVQENGIKPTITIGGCSYKQIRSYMWVLLQIQFEIVMLVVLLYTSFRQMSTVANDSESLAFPFFFLYMHGLPYREGCAYMTETPASLVGD